jgi:hypothetical protein
MRERPQVGVLEKISYRVNVLGKVPSCGNVFHSQLLFFFVLLIAAETIMQKRIINVF